MSNLTSKITKIFNQNQKLIARERAVKIREDKLFNIQQSITNQQNNIDPQSFIAQGREEGFQEGLEAGLRQAAEAAAQKTPKQKKFGGYANPGTFLVGEDGMELITTSENSMVIPNDKLNIIPPSSNTQRVAIQPVTQIITKKVPQPVPIQVATPVPIAVVISASKKSLLKLRNL